MPRILKSLEQNNISPLIDGIGNGKRRLEVGLRLKSVACRAEMSDARLLKRSTGKELCSGAPYNGEAIREDAVPSSTNSGSFVISVVSSRLTSWAALGLHAFLPAAIAMVVIFPALRPPAAIERKPDARAITSNRLPPDANTSSAAPAGGANPPDTELSSALALLPRGMPPRVLIR